MKYTILALFLTCSVQASFVSAAVIVPTDTNALRDYPYDGVADEVTSYANGYVNNTYQANLPDTSRWESRAFVEFDLASITDPYNYVELSFAVGRYNSTNIPDQLLSIFGYEANGSVGLDDWNRMDNFVGETGPIAGFDADSSNRGELLYFNLDITKLVMSALDNGSSYLGFNFLNLAVTEIDPTDPLAYSSLLVVYNTQLQTTNSVPEPGTLTIFILGLIALSFIWLRKNSELMGRGQLMMNRVGDK